MTSDEPTATRRIGIGDLLRALPGMARHTPQAARGAFELLTLKPTTRASIGQVFAGIAARHPERVFLTFEGAALRYGEANARVNRYAATLSGRGVRAGSVVGVLATNRPETLLVALAAVKLGAVAGMLNHNQRGDVLEHSQKVLDSTVLVVGAECRAALDSAGAPVGEVLGLADRGTVLAGHPDLDELAAGAPATEPQGTDVRAGDTAFYIFTSGTTGLPKASAMSHGRWLKGMSGLGRLAAHLGPRDTLYCCLPLYHNNALTVSLATVLAGGATLALGRSFSASRFWDEVRASGATAFCYIGELCRYLLNQPERPDDREHRVRLAIGNGLRPEIWAAFAERFGIEKVMEFYGSSEGNTAFVNAFNLRGTAGLCPMPFAVVAYDPATERPRRDGRGRGTRVATGTVGLLLTKVTEHSPFDGYTDRTATEHKLVRDLFRAGDCWFDTGDLVRAQGWRHIAFVDRLGDTYRWKGENVATTEVEGALAAHPDVAQAVAFGVAVPGTDGRAGMAAVKLAEGATVDGPALAGHLLDRLPPYAVPLFLRVVDEVEQTATFKSRKGRLRDEGYDPDRVRDPLYVLAGRDEGYVPAYPEYPQRVAAGQVRI
ncbi:MAG TPA: long-chain-acyl-CoA synthetase [Actinophytocola sp.]|uniref:long-chain-acyl-CoA synthetase n=1 Tax=Actinophytocola sp. TaxID=1872138 RepID=UPI002DB7FA85|nr:long-chain-acyl-CoA synthetase [Actinophytocola sp.]HEU5473183.1 long-chain-acyl-CoA synthetase [Actinophytocola sp.]